MLGTRTLLINPPPINGIAFTRQGRCQEREDVLGTTKPPYSLLVAATLLQERGIDVTLVDQTGEQLGTDALIARFAGAGYRPTLIVFCSTTPTLEADAAEMLKLKRAFDAPLFCFGPHASTAARASMEKVPFVDGMLVGEPEEAIVALAECPSRDELDRVDSLTYRAADGTIVSHRTHGVYQGFLTMPFPAWSLLRVRDYTLPLEGQPYLLVETSRGCPYSCDFCVAHIHQGHKFRERPAKAIVDEIERGQREFGVNHFYLWADTVTLNAKSFGQFCDEVVSRGLDIKWFGNARADNLVDPAFVKKLKDSGCWMLAMGIESESEDTRKNMVKRLEQQKIRAAIKNLKDAGIFSFAFFIFGYPGETPESIARTTDYAIDLDPDFANFYPAVPYPGTELYEKCVKDGLLASDDWSKMEYSYYILRGNGLDADVVMRAIHRAKRRFFLRPGYIVRHFGDIAKLALTKQAVVWDVATRTLFGRRVVDTVPTAPGTATVQPTTH